MEILLADPVWSAVPMIHDNTGRASTACHYSPSLVAEDQLHGSKDTLTLKGEKALLELLLDMVCRATLLHQYSTTSYRHHFISR